MTFAVALGLWFAAVAGIFWFNHKATQADKRIEQEDNETLATPFRPTAESIIHSAAGSDIATHTELPPA